MTEIPSLNQWLHSIEEEAKRRNLPSLFIAASDESHPLGGGSLRYNSLGESHPSSLLQSALIRALHTWEKKNAINSKHDWRKKPNEPLLIKSAVREKKEGKASGHLTWITGRSGSGKSTMARQLADQYDLTFGSDTGYHDPGLGRWHEPTSEEKTSIRQERTEAILQALKEGKRVLFEGAPGPTMKYPEELFKNFHEIIALDAPKEKLLQNVIQRSKSRGSYFDPKGRQDDLDNFERLYQNYDEGLAHVRRFTKAPVRIQQMDYMDKHSGRKRVGHVEQRMQERAPGHESFLREVEHRLRKTPLEKKKTYSIPLPNGGGYIVVGDIGKRHVPKTVLGPEMYPPGEILRILEQEKKASMETAALVGRYIGGLS